MFDQMAGRQMTWFTSGRMLIQCRQSRVFTCQGLLWSSTRVLTAMLLLTQVQTTQTTTIFSAPKRHKYNTALIKLSQNTLFLSSILDLHTQFMLHWTPLNIINIIYINSSPGEYSCLKVELIFKREFSYYLITIYVPCCMLVIVSWVR